MKTYSETVIRLSEETNFSARKCAKELKTHNYDYEATLEYLKQLRLDPVEIYFDAVSTLFSSENGKTMTITDASGNEVVSLSWIIPLLFLFLIDIPSWVIASLLLLMLLFNLNFRLENTVKRDIIKDTTVDLNTYNQSKQSADEIILDDEGYYQFTIK